MKQFFLVLCAVIFVSCNDTKKEVVRKDVSVESRDTSSPDSNETLQTEYELTFDDVYFQLSKAISRKNSLTKVIKIESNNPSEFGVIESEVPIIKIGNSSYATAIAGYSLSEKILFWESDTTVCYVEISHRLNKRTCGELYTPLPASKANEVFLTIANYLKEN